VNSNLVAYFDNHTYRVEFDHESSHLPSEEARSMENAACA
jgi:hypothetical protein